MVYDLTTAEAFDAVQEPLPQEYVYEEVVELERETTTFGPLLGKFHNVTGKSPTKVSR